VDNDAQSFDDFADKYDRRDELNGGWITDWLRGLLAGRHGNSALDLGCGTGRVALLLAEHYDHVRAVDLSPDMIEIARAKRPHPRVSYEQGDLAGVTGSFDLVVSIMVLHHVPDLPTTLNHIAELVAPGGRAVVIDAAQLPTTRWMILLRNSVGFVREVKHSWEKMRLNSDRQWVDHLVSDRFLQPSEFLTTYSRALPGVAIESVSRLYTAVWQRSAPSDSGDSASADGS
jgi:2-polyprenyl-3-methyl-5-hydroxy-6-metoxy-1,4-benzoquinol methylase